jgi:hypothetical protein
MEKRSRGLDISLLHRTIRPMQNCNRPPSSLRRKFADCFQHAIFLGAIFGDISKGPNAYSFVASHSPFPEVEKFDLGESSARLAYN